MSNLIDSLRNHLSRLSRQEAAVALTILVDPEEILLMPLNQLAERAGVSQPTVIRLCRTIGCEGYAELKLRLAQSLGTGTPYISAVVEPGDMPAAYTGKIFDASISALQSARNGLDVRSVERAVRLLARARRVVTFGLGGSAPIALDAQHKLSRFSTPCQAVTDPVFARMLLAGMNDEDVLLTISNTGRTEALLELARRAADGGINVLAVTAPESPLARIATLTLGIEPMEDAELFTPMASRIAHLAVIDVLATGVLLALGPAIQPQLAAIKTSLRETRRPRGDADGSKS
jgi:RpiR family carbohydrate utilization transcriptional regulator